MVALLRFFPVALTLFLALPALADTATLRQTTGGYQGTSDARIVCCDRATINEGGNGLFDLIIDGSTSVLIKFNVLTTEGGPVPPGSTIQSATLSLYKNDGPAAVLELHRVLRAWSEGAVTWNNTGMSGAWSGTGGAFAPDIDTGVDARTTAADSTGCPADEPGLARCWMQFDLRAAVGAFSGGAANNGWKLIYVSDPGGAQTNSHTPKELYSRDNTRAPSLRPTLTIDWTPPTTPPGPTGITSPVTLQQDKAGYTGTTDARITCCATAGTNEGANQLYDLIGETSTSTLIRFKVFQREGGPVPDNVAITSATLKLYKNWGQATKFTLKRLLRDWDESFVTWNTTGVNGASWGQIGAMGSTDVGAVDATATNGDSQQMQCPADEPGLDACWVNFDVKTALQAFSGGASNYGWKLAYLSDADGTTTNINQSKEMYSSENTRATSLRPTLIVAWSTSPGVPTASLTATPTSGAAPLTVTFDASRSSGTITSLHLDFGDGTHFVDWTDPAVKQTFTYQTATTYHPALTVTNAAGTSQPVSVTVAAGGPWSAQPQGGRAVETFHSMGLYWDPPASATIVNNEISVRYRKAGDDPNAAGFVWKIGHPLWFDPDSPAGLEKARGSVVHLEPGVTYSFEFGTGDPANPTWTNSVSGTTWSETFNGFAAQTQSGQLQAVLQSQWAPGTARYPNSRTSAVWIAPDKGGSPGNYAIHDYAGNATANASTTDSSSFGVIVSASYVVLRNLTVKGGASGIMLDPGVHDVIIDNVDISHYGANADDDAGVKFPNESDLNVNTYRIVIQNCRIHDPAYGSRPWPDHPDKSAPIVIYPTGGQIVVRNNATWSTTTNTIDGPPDFDHFHQDGLVMGGENTLGLGHDVDIYRNIVMHYRDDGLETDGMGINNRVWANYFDYGGASAVSTTAVRVGPTYVWRNVYNRQRKYFYPTPPGGDPSGQVPWGNDPNGRDYFLKCGGNPSAPDVNGLRGNGGRRYLYHNTSLQPPASFDPGASGPMPLGAGFGVGGTGEGTVLNTKSRNNVFEMFRDHPVFSFGTTGNVPDSSNDLHHDLTNGSFPGGTSGLVATPAYVTGEGWQSRYNGNYHLAPGPGATGAEPIPNFNDGSNGPYGAADGPGPMPIGPFKGGN